MRDHSGLKYLFDQLNINASQYRWVATISELEFEIRYIKGKENWVKDALSRNVQVNHIAAMSCYGTQLHDRILQVGHWDDKYMDIMHRLQWSTCIVTGTGVGICTSIGTGVSAGRGDQDAGYHLMVDGLVRFRDKIYVSNCNELKKLILSEFHVKPYLGHVGYQKTLTMVNKFYIG